MSGKEMPVYRSLLGKYVGIAVALFVLIASLIVATFYLTVHIQGEAQRINIAGRQRMHLFHLANHAHFLTGGQELPGGIDLHLQEINTEQIEYEQALHSLLEGCKACDLMPFVVMRDHEDLEDRLHRLISLWEEQQKPLLQQIMTRRHQVSNKQNEKICTDCHAAFIGTFDEVDGFVYALARHNDRIISEFNRVRFVILAVFGVVVIGIAFFIRQKMLRPVMELQAAAASMELGKFPKKLLLRTSDEIGMLTETFNRMAVALAANFQEMEKQVMQRTAELRNANKDLRAFVTTVSHDLGAPLRAIEGFARAIREDAGPMSPELDSHLTHITKAVEYMESMLEDLLQYSRISYQELRLEPIDLKPLVDQALHELSQQVAETAAVVTVEEPLPVAMAHHNILLQVIINLVGNALKFVAPGNTPEIRIRGEIIDGRARLSIIDNGIGIAPKDIERIFHILVRLHGTETYPGTGIGLASVRRGVGRLGGMCGVDSKPGQGSTFWIELPPASMADTGNQPHRDHNSMRETA